MFASHPLFESPSQSANPAAQTGVHTPATQLEVPCAFAQSVPHVPQFVAVSRLVSQPLAVVASQSPYPAWQLGRHKPELHTAVPCAFEHRFVQPPHLPAALVMSVSQPFVGSLSQSE